MFDPLSTLKGKSTIKTNGQYHQHENAAKSASENLHTCQYDNSGFLQDGNSHDQMQKDLSFDQDTHAEKKTHLGIDDMDISGEVSRDASIENGGIETDETPPGNNEVCLTIDISAVPCRVTYIETENLMSREHFLSSLA